MNAALEWMRPPVLPVVVYCVVACLGWLSAMIMGFLLGKRRAIKGAEAMALAWDSAEQANTELREALEQLESAAGTDRLTRAWNRRHFEEAATTLMALANRKRDPLSLIMFDLDHFKQINDTHGHIAGDQVLKGVAERVRHHLRISDSLTRWGGEEFLVLAPGTRILGAHALAEKIRESVASQPFDRVNTVTVSLGVAEFLPGETLEDWVRRTDQALYEAKHEGRNRVVMLQETSTARQVPYSSLLELHWDEAYECGQAQIDEQHRMLFDLSNGLLPFITGGDLGTDFQLQLKLFLAHVAQHFHDEEALLAQAHYPRLMEHAKIHKNLLKTARVTLEDVDAQRLERAQLLSFLALEFIQGHLLTEDRDFFPLFQGNPLESKEP